MGFLPVSDGKESACNAGDLGLIPWLGRSPGEGNGYPLEVLSLGNSIDRGTWRATVCGVTNSQKWLRDYHYYYYYLKTQNKSVFFAALILIVRVRVRVCVCVCVCKATQIFIQMFPTLIHYHIVLSRLHPLLPCNPAPELRNLLLINHHPIPGLMQSDFRAV